MKKKHYFCFFILVYLLILSACQTKWLNTEHSIVLTSFWNDEVSARHTMDKDPFYNAQFLDFDTGSEKQDLGTDVYFYMSCDSSECSASFENLNETRIHRYGEGKPDRYSCMLLFDRTESMDLKSRTMFEREGFFSCVLTTEGRYGWVYCESYEISDYEDASVKLRYYIWSND
ncbi:MAG: hypothetical protein ACOYKC_02335 [Anaerolineaceae bacterium]